ncbi:hypothetical protein HK097_002569 [Rhizophlyctis rosea]|uniref:Branchpoint-bridging protein n=1 Tax=Rhizophlyctis rosea TaxID=64517 RepID=A0AAD5SGU0_9FUNG|nr:hypothetical protein HK097_002569 [Rhizophlyctis rosea]
MYGATRTGTNNIPLGTRRKRGAGGDDDHQQSPSYNDNNDRYNNQSGGDSYGHGSSSYSHSHGQSAAASSYPTEPVVKQEVKQEAPDADRDGRPRKRRSRWGKEDVKINVPGLPTTLPSGLTQEQIDGYVIHMRLEEIHRKLQIKDYIPEESARSPSPEPIYGPDGKRINTREYRYRKKLEDERHKLVEEGMRKVPGFRPPADYKRPTKMSDKLYIPVKDYPEINFIGQLIGPRGTTLKRIESESGAKISIRGKGSVKEGKSRLDGALAPGEEDDLHCLVTADSEEKVKIAMREIEKVIETAASVPEGQNELKRMQLRYLAELNGTLRDDEGQICPNCGATGHRGFECPEKSNYTANLICRLCGGAGHIARDCRERANPAKMQEIAQQDQKLDNEYANLMAELGEGGGGGARGGSGHYGPGRGGAPSGAGGVTKPPWQSGGDSASGNGSAVPPWAQRKDVDGPPGAGGGYGGGAPWQQQQHYGGGGEMPPGFGPPGMAPPGAPSYGGYAPPPPPGGYPGAPPPPPSFAPPPPLPGNAGGYGGYGGGGGHGGVGAPPPPPPAWNPPPPPPMQQPPPPPPPM